MRLTQNTVGTLMRPVGKPEGLGTSRPDSGAMTSDATGVVEDLVERVESAPESITAEEIERFLTHDEKNVQKRAADVCMALARNDPETVEPVGPILIEMAGDDFHATKNSALGALGVLAEDSSEVVRDGFERYAEGLTDPLPVTRLLASKPFALVTADHPELAAEHLPAILQAVDFDPPVVPTPEETEIDIDREPVRSKLTDEQKAHNTARELAAAALVDVAAADPEAIETSGDRIFSLVEDSNDIVAGAAIDAIAELATAEYDVPAEVVDSIEETLDGGSKELRARAIKALGHLGAVESVDAIQAVARDTDDEDLAEFAEDTVRWLDPDRPE